MSPIRVGWLSLIIECLNNLTNRMDELILKCLQGEASDGEQREVWNWLKEDVNFERYQKLRDTWIATGLIHRDSKLDLEKQYEKVQARIQAKITPHKTFTIYSLWGNWGKIAAIVILAFLLGGSITYFSTNRTFKNIAKNQYEIEAPRGAKIKMNLADGTKVWLNAGSKLSYTNAYNVENRRVKLVGEGYFEVAKNKEIPFYVMAGGVKVRAVGTAFNVKAYPDEKQVETTLVEGVVDVTDGGKTYRLEPSQKASVIRNLPRLIQKEQNGKKFCEQVSWDKIHTVDVVISNDVNTDIYTSWRGKRWIFERETLADFTKMLERRYDIHVYVMDPKLNDYKISGSIEQQTLEQLLNAVRLTVPLKYTITNKEVLLTLDKRLEREYKVLMK